MPKLEIRCPSCKKECSVTGLAKVIVFSYDGDIETDYPTVRNLDRVNCSRCQFEATLQEFVRDISKPALPQQEYLKEQRCPACGGYDVGGGSVDVGNGEATQDIGCNECGASWYDNYKLAGYSHLEEK